MDEGWGDRPKVLSLVGCWWWTDGSSFVAGGSFGDICRPHQSGRSGGDRNRGGRHRGGNAGGGRHGRGWQLIAGCFHDDRLQYLLIICSNQYQYAGEAVRRRGGEDILFAGSLITPCSFKRTRMTLMNSLWAPRSSKVVTGHVKFFVSNQRTKSCSNCFFWSYCLLNGFGS